jgi:beta-lactamase class A
MIFRISQEQIMSDKLLFQTLERHLRQEIDGFPGVIGLHLHDIYSGQEVTIHGEEIFPTASSIKIHVLAQLLLRAERGEVDLNERLTLPQPDSVQGSGVLAYLHGPIQMSLLDVATLMIIVSDNAATNICIDRAGMAETNQLIQELGLSQTVLRRKMTDLVAAVANQENVSTPRDLAGMMLALHQGRPTPGVAEQALAILHKPKSSLLTRALPEETPIANKPGWIPMALCDVGLVGLSHRPYVVAIMSKFGLVDAMTQEDHLCHLLRQVHQTMTALDQANQYGRGVR